MKTQEQDNGRNVWTVMLYHVTDAQGMHKFVTMNSDSIERWGGRKGFEEILARQYKTFELFETSRVAYSGTPGQYEILDPEGAEEGNKRLYEAMAAWPNPPCIEPWVPERKEDTLPPPPHTNKAQWRPMATLKREVGGTNLQSILQRIVLVNEDVDIQDTVKPEFVAVARARGGARLSELKEDFRKILEPSLIRAIEDGE